MDATTTISYEEFQELREDNPQVIVVHEFVTSDIFLIQIVIWSAVCMLIGYLLEKLNR